jgi:hypothetical protein
MFTAFFQYIYKKIFINIFLNSILKRTNQRTEQYYREICFLILLEDEKIREVGFYTFKEILKEEIQKIDLCKLYPYTTLIKNCINNSKSSNKSLLYKYICKCFFNISKFDLMQIEMFCKFIEQLKIRKY